VRLCSLCRQVLTALKTEAPCPSIALVTTDKGTQCQPRGLQSECRPGSLSVNTLAYYLLVSRICCFLKNKKDLSTSSLAFCIPVQGRILMMRCSAMVSIITFFGDYIVEV
jgi:hypothetical protein